MLVKTVKRFMERHGPSPDHLHRVPMLRPVARYIGNPNVWHFNRHSVARGVALGLFLGFAIPMGFQLVIAALIAVSARANIAVTALFTSVSNPVTVLPLGLATIKVGQWLLGHEAVVYGQTALLDIIEEAPASFLVGGVFLGSIAGAVGFLAIHFAWRWWIGRRWAKRLARRRASA